MKKIVVVFLLLTLLVVVGGVAAQNGAIVDTDLLDGDWANWYCPAVHVYEDFTLVYKAGDDPFVDELKRLEADITVTYGDESFRDHVNLSHARLGYCDGCKGVGYKWVSPGGKPLMLYAGQIGIHGPKYVDDDLLATYNQYQTKCGVEGLDIFTWEGAVLAYCARFNLPLNMVCE